jgi:hypothetical protein
MPAGRALAPSVAAFLRQAFNPNTEWCTGERRSSSCAMPGFAVGFGGTSGVSVQAMAAAAAAVSGERYVPGADASPSMAAPFHTLLDLDPVFPSVGVGDVATCLPGDALRDARWLSAVGARNPRPLVEVDLVAAALFGRDGSSPSLCLRTPGAAGARLVATSLSGHVVSAGPPTPVASAFARLGIPYQAPTNLTSDDEVAADARPATGASLLAPGTQVPVGGSTLDLAVGPDGSFAGTANLTAGGHLVAVSVSGRWVTTPSGRAFRGRASFDAFGGRFEGGFRADTIDGGDAPTATWTFDGAPLQG